MFPRAITQTANLAIICVFVEALVGCTEATHHQPPPPGGAVSALTGPQLKHLLGKDYADPYVAIPDILAACDRLEQLLAANEPVAEVDYVLCDRKGNFGFGDHATLALQFGSDRNRETIFLDIGRRPQDSAAPNLSVVRVYKERDFYKYALALKRPDFSKLKQYPVTLIGISALCPNTRAKKLGRNVLSTLSEFRKGTQHDPTPWNFNILFNNCARYVQNRLVEVVEPDEIRQMVANYRERHFINPTDFGEYLTACDSFARLLNSQRLDFFSSIFPSFGRKSLATPLLPPRLSRLDTRRIKSAFQRLEPSEKKKWLNLFARHPELQSEAALFQEELTLP